MTHRGWPRPPAPERAPPPKPTFCPATMCPLFATEGSPWTGDKNHHCQRAECLWFQGGHCTGRDAAMMQVLDAGLGLPVLQIGAVRARRGVAGPPKTFDCPRASECQWQAEASPGLCPPRLALARGLDPKVVAY